MKIPSHVRGRSTRAQVRGVRVGPKVPTCEVDVVHLDSVREAQSSLPSEHAIMRVADVLAILSSTTRLKMLLALQPGTPGPRRELCVCDLAMVIGASKSLTSHQLRLLRSAGLVMVRRAGKLAYYRLAEWAGVDLLEDALRMAHHLPDSDFVRVSEGQNVFHGSMCDESWTQGVTGSLRSSKPRDVAALSSVFPTLSIAQ